MRRPCMVKLIINCFILNFYFVDIMWILKMFVCKYLYVQLVYFLLCMYVKCLEKSTKYNIGLNNLQWFTLLFILSIIYIYIHFYYIYIGLYIVSVSARVWVYSCWRSIDQLYRCQRQRLRRLNKLLRKPRSETSHSRQYLYPHNQVYKHKTKMCFIHIHCL